MQFVFLVDVDGVQDDRKSKENTRTIFSDNIRFSLDAKSKPRMRFSTRNTQYWPGKEMVRVRQLANMAACLVPDNFIDESLTLEAPKTGRRANIREGVTKKNTNKPGLSCAKIRLSS